MYNQSQMRQLLENRRRVMGTWKKLADASGVAERTIRDAAYGNIQKPNKKILAYLGLERVKGLNDEIVYRMRRPQ